MISFFNRIGNTWIAKAIFVALGISMMAFWGLGGIGNTSRSDQTAIQIGSHRISLAELSKEFDAERAKLGQLTGHYISPKNAIEMGLLQQAVQRKISEGLHQAIQEDLGLAASDQAVRKYVERHPAFKDALGNFDRGLFMTYLSQNRLTEEQLAEQLRQELATQHLSSTLRFVAPAPTLLAELYWVKQNELRDVEGLLIQTDKIKIDAIPSEEELKDYYEAYLTDFMSPETRDLALLTISPKELAKTLQISPADIQARYEEQKDSYAIPEKRHIYQIRFASKEAAETLKPQLNAQNFVAKSIEQGQTESETNFGLVTRTELLPELSDSAFSAPLKGIVGSIKSSVGWHLLFVAEIAPAVQPVKAEVYNDIKQKLAAEAAYDKMNETTRSLEDLLGEGKSLKEAAEILGLHLQSFQRVDITGKNLPAPFQNQELLKEVFILKEGEASALVEDKEGFVVAEVSHIYPTQAKSLAEVYPEVKNIWRTEQQKERLAELSQQALEQFKQGSIPAKLGQVVVAKSVSSLKQQENIPPEALSAIFVQEKGYENAVATPVPTGTFISVVKNVKKPVMNQDLLPRQKDQLSAETAAVLQDALIADYANRLKLHVNMEAIQKAFSVYQSE